MSELAKDTKSRLSTRNLIIVLATIAVYFIIVSLPRPEELSPEGL